MDESPQQGSDLSLKDQILKLPNERRWALSCYLPVFNIVSCLITLVRMVDSKFCRFHARQGLVLFLLWFLTIVVALFSQIVSLMLWGVVLFLHAFGVMMAFGNKMTKVPVVGRIAEKIPEYYFFRILTGKEPDVGVEKSIQKL